MKPKIDAEFASLIPPLSADEYMQLEANLIVEGCRDPLVVWGEILIDGHNRLQICTKHNIQYEVVERNFEDRDDAMIYIIHNQLGRRNLSIGNQGILVLRLEPLYKAKAKENQQQSPGRGKKGFQNSGNLFSKIHTDKELARIAGVSHDTIDRVRKIVEHGTPEQVQRIKEGGKGNSVSAVYDEVRKLTTSPPVASSDSGGEDNRPPEAAGDMFDEIRKTAVPPPVDPSDCGGEDNDSPGTDDGGREPVGDISEPAGKSEADIKEDDLERIRGYVADLKNPGLDRSFTTEMFLSEYEAFAERFIRSIGAFAYEPYKETYPLLSDAERKKITALGSSMIKAIEKQKTKFNYKGMSAYEKECKKTVREQ